jgi:hypothetical protein
MSPDKQKFATEAKALAAEGRNIDALATRMEHLRLKANSYLDLAEIEIVDVPEAPYRSRAHKDGIYAEALAEEIARRETADPISPDLPYLNGARYAYQALSNVSAILRAQGPVDAERIAAAMLAAMDLAAVDSFCERIDNLETEVETANLAQANREQHSKGAAVANAQRSKWHRPFCAFIAAYEHRHPEQDRHHALRAGQAFIKKTFQITPENNTFDTVLRRKADIYNQARELLTSNQRGEVMSADHELMADLQRAFDEMGPSSSRVFHAVKVT